MLLNHFITMANKLVRYYIEVTYMIRIYILLFVLVTAVNGAVSQRVSEEEIGLEALYIQANQKKLLGKYEEAIKLYKRLLEKAPLNAPTYYDLARIYQSQGALESAIANGKKAIKYDADNTWYRLTLATIYETAMEYQDAANQYAYLAPKEKDQSLYDRWADALVLSNQEMAAIGVYNQADKIWGPNEGRSDIKADLYLNLNKKKEAVKEIEQWVKKYPYESRYKIKLSQFYLFIGQEKKARKIVEKMLDKDPDNEEAISIRQAMMAKKGDSNFEDLKKIVQNPKLSLESKVKAMMPSLLTGSKDKAIQIVKLTKILSDNYPYDAPAQAIHGDALYLNEDLEGATEYYQKTLGLSKSVYEVWDQLMRSLHLLERYEDLSSISSDAIDYYPNQAGPYYYQGLVAYASGDMKEATSMAEEALFISGGRGLIAEVSMVLQSKIRGEQGDFIKAIETLSEGEIQLSLPSSFELLGDLYIGHGDKQKAQEAYNKALGLGGDSVRIQQKLRSI